MSSQIPTLLRLTCLLLGGLVCWQVYGLVNVPEPFDNLSEFDLVLEEPEPEPPGQTAAPTDPSETQTDPLSDKQTDPSTDDSRPTDEQKVTPDEAKQPAKKKAQKNNREETSSSPSFPKRYEVVATSGILGKAPTQKPAPPALVGVLGKYAIIRAPDGKEDLVSEGGEFGGVKVIKISTNRVLIEFEAQQKELTVYAGMGSASLLPPKEEGASDEASKPPAQGKDASSGKASLK